LVFIIFSVNVKQVYYSFVTLSLDTGAKIAASFSSTVGKWAKKRSDALFFTGLHQEWHMDM